MPTPHNPSFADIDAGLSLMGGRVSVGINEMLRLWRDNMKPYIEDRQATGKLPAQVEVPKGFFYTPSDQTAIALNTVALTCTVHFEDEIPGSFRKTVYPIAFWAQAPLITSPTDFMSGQWDAVDVLGAILLPYLGGTVDPWGRRAWGILRPLDQQAMHDVMPEAWKQLSGPMMGWEMHLFPGSNSWDNVI